MKQPEPTQSLDREEQAVLGTNIPKVQNVNPQDQTVPFTGQWMPSLDGTLIGAENYQSLINYRYSEDGIDPVNGYYDFNATAITDYVTLKSGIHFRTNRADDSYILVHAKKDASTESRIYQSQSAVGAAEGTGSFEATQLYTDSEDDLEGHFAQGPAGVVAYCNGYDSAIWSGEEGNIADVFTLSVDAAPNYGKITDADADDWALPVEQTDSVTNADVSDYLEFTSTGGGGAGNELLMVLTTRPIKGIKLYIDPLNANLNAANTNALDVEVWNGSAFENVAGLSDGTSKLTTTGTISFTDTFGTAKPMHYQERYLYCYIIQLESTAGDSEANVYQITVDASMQTPSNVWDGIYRQPIQVQLHDNVDDADEDYTVHVQDTSTEGTPVGLYIGGWHADDYVYLMFQEPMAAIKFVMLGALLNKADAQLTAADGVQYWNGTAFSNLTFVDETLDDAGNSSFAKTGLVYWNVPSNEEKVTLFGSTGYCYRLSVDATVTGAARDDAVVDLVYGVPAQLGINGFDFPALFKNRLMLCSYSEGNEGNRIDYCTVNAPDVFNGDDTSDDGYQSIYVGGIDKIVAARQLYNRFGSNIFSTFVILKQSEIWLLTGDSPLDFELYPISFTLGCPAPRTVATAEVGFELGEQVERNIIMWVSHSGPVMFDGAVINPVPGLEKYFDPNETESINFDALDQAAAFFDSTYNEWNIFLPTGSATVPNKWFCFDLRRKKWFEKSTNLGEAIYNGFNATLDNGKHIIYGCAGDGRLYELETGTSWNGNPIVQTILTGDFFPSGNQWDITLLRRIKFVCERIPSADADVNIYYQANTESDAGLALTFRDAVASLTTTASAGLSFIDAAATLTTTGSAGVSWADAPTSIIDLTVDLGIRRLVRNTLAMNEQAWCHALKFEYTSANYRLKPIMWGYQWITSRKDTND